MMSFFWLNQPTNQPTNQSINCMQCTHHSVASRPKSTSAYFYPATPLPSTPAFQVPLQHIPQELVAAAPVAPMETALDLFQRVSERASLSIPAPHATEILNPTDQIGSILMEVSNRSFFCFCFLLEG
jgi:hypothetical protein